jgi:5'-nucleotidase
MTFPFNRTSILKNQVSGARSSMPLVVAVLLLVACQNLVGGGASQSIGQNNDVISVKLIAFNDFHGHLKTPTDGVPVADPVDPSKRVNVIAGGIEYLASQIDALRNQNANHVVVAAGDMIGATPLISAAFHDEPTIEAMNLIGVDFTSVGNHEFDKGKEELLRMQNGGCHPKDGCRDGQPFPGARFRYLAANVIDVASAMPFFPEYEIRVFEGIPIAFIGVVLRGTPAVASSPAAIAGLEFKDEADTVNALIPGLKARGIESIVLLIHEGGYTQGLYNDLTCPGMSGPIIDILRRLDKAVDVVISGHTHRAYNCRIDGRLVTSAASYGRLVTDIDLSISPITRDVVSAKANNILIDPKTTAKAPRQSQLVEKYDKLVAPVANKVVGLIAADVTASLNAAGESAMGELIADAQLAATAGGARGAQIAFMNPGGIRGGLVFRAPGQVIYGDLFSVQPFGNALITMSLTGAQIKALLEAQWDSSQPNGELILQVSKGFEYSWDSTRRVGDRVDAASMKINAKPIDPAKTYRATVNSFLSYGGDNFGVLKSGTDRVEGTVDLDALVQYLGANKSFSPLPPGRIRRLR